MEIASRPKYVGCALALLTLALFWPATRFGFIDLDDDAYVASNPFVQQGWTRQSLVWATTTVYENYWVPATWLSFMTDRELQGASPRGYHRTNVLLHAANVGLLFLLAYRLTGHLWGSALLAALFGWHPQRVEAVVWISSRKDVLSTLFGLLALLAYVSCVRFGSERRHLKARGYYYALAWVGMAASLAAKPMLVTFPFLLLLLDFWPLKRFGWAGASREVKSENEQLSPSGSGIRFRDLLIEKAPFLLLSVGFSCLTLFTHQAGGAIRHSVPWTERLGTISAAYCRYVAKSFWPVDLAVRYPPFVIPVLQGVGCVLVLIVVSAFCWWQRRQRAWLWMGWLWFLGAFVPIIGCVRIGTADFADRFTYVPAMGLCVVWTGIILSVLPNWWRGRAGFITATILVTLCGVATRHQMGFWTTGENLFRRALEVTENNPAALNALGRELEKQGRWPEAAAEYERALRIDPGFVQAHSNLGNVLGLLKRHEEAIRHFEAALQAVPKDAKVHSNYGVILSQAGRKADGMQQMREALRLNPDLSDAHFNLGHALLAERMMTEALEQFVLAARINPLDDVAQFEAGRLYLARGEREQAMRCFEAALRVKPGDVEYLRAIQGAGR